MSTYAARESRAIATIAQLFGPQMKVTPSPRERCTIVDGALQQQHVQVRLTYAYTKYVVDTAEGSMNWPATTTVFLPRRVDGVLLDLRPQDRGLIGGQLLVDVELGDRHFDEYFSVDGAPSEVVRALIDERTRRAMVQLLQMADPYAAPSGKAPCSFLIEPDGLRITIRRDVFDVGTLRLMADVVLAAGARIGPAVEAVRSAPGGAQRCDAELAELLRRRRAQTTRGTIVGVLAGTVILALLALGFWFWPR